MRRIITILWLAFSWVSICLTQTLEEEAAPMREVSIVHWNIGHFSLGKKQKTTIPFEQADSMAAVYHRLIDRYDADVFGLCEYSGLFTIGGYDAALVLFGNYRYDLIGKQTGYNCNAVFSKFPLTEYGHYTYSLGNQGRYATSCTFFIDTIAVRFVETHLDWSPLEYRTLQIEELIQMTADYPYVIICGDFNVKDNQEYIKFLEAGYTSFTFGNDKSLATGAGSADDIMIRGFEFVTTHRGWKPALSDHGYLTCKLRLIAQE